MSDGIAVDARLRTPAVYAVGDCASFPSSRAGGRVRLESVQNAVDQARFVAAHICGKQDTPYGDLPWFWSDQLTVNLQIAGLAPGHDRTVIPR